MRIFEDTPHFKRLRRRLVNGIRDKGITDIRVLNAIYSIPRQFFMKEDLEDMAYVDKAFPIDEGQTISQPYTVAYQTQLLEVNPGDKILEIGSGSAYQTSVLALMGAEVFTIERQKQLFDKYEHFPYLHQLSQVHFYYGDGYNGLEQFAPFDKILVTAAVSFIPPALINQLKPGGLLVLPLGSPSLQQMVRVKKLESGEIIKEHFHHFSFVPMLEGREE
jgi:protein-L-isoaspartate(D-aspartate) O-methyltransferase